MIKRCLLALSLIVASATPVLALDFTVTGAVLTVTYKEPSTNTDGSALNDLDYTSVYYRLCPTGGTCTATYTKSHDVPASVITGGGNISTQATVPVTAGQERVAEVYVTATDTSANQSAESVHASKRVDRLAPNAPQ